MLANCVDLIDPGPAVHEQPARGLHIGERQSRSGLDEQRGGAAGHYEEHRVVRRSCLDGLHQQLGAGDARGIRHRMPAFENSNTPQRQCMAVLHEHSAGFDAIAEHGFEPARERRGRLARARHEHASAKRDLD
jgi:hypothetical protein